MRALLAVALIAACSGDDPRSQVCGQVAKLCGLTADETVACKKDMSEAGISGDVVKKMAACGKDADSCPELLGCYTGVAAGEVSSIVSEFEEGFERGVGNPSRDPECADFKPPTGDCTSADRSCEWDSDCPGGMRCNKELDRCFDPKGSCVGTRCTFDSSCARGERCNNLTKRCFKVEASQHCMPCVFDKDCGGSRCVGDTCAKE